MGYWCNIHREYVPDEWVSYVLNEEMKTCICKMCLTLSNSGKLGVAKAIKEIKDEGSQEEKANILIWFENIEEKLEENEQKAKIAEKKARNYWEDFFENPLDNLPFFSRKRRWRRKRRRRYGF